MPNQFDGSIKLGVELEASEVSKTSKTLEKEIKKIFNVTGGQSTDKKFDALLLKMDKLTTKSALARNALSKLEAQDASLSDQMSRLNDDITGVNEELANVTVGTQEHLELQHVLEEDKKALAELQEEQRKLRESNEYIKLKNDVNQLNNEMTVAIRQASTFNDVIAQTNREQRYEKLKEDLKELPLHIQLLSRAIVKVIEGGKIFFQGFKENLPAIINKFKELAKTIGGVVLRALKSVAKVVGNIVKTIGSAVKSGFVKLKDAIFGVKKNSDGLAISFKTLLRYGLGIRSLFTLFNKLRSAVKSGIDMLAASNGGYNATNAAIHSLTDSLNYLKGAWGAAFAPIIQYVAPILVKFIDLLASAANMIGAFFAALTGKGTIVKATKQTSGLGDASGKASKAMDKEKKSADKLKSTLAGFDDLDVLDIDDNPMEDLADTLDDMGSGGAGAGVEFEEISIDQMLPEELLDWIKRLKEAWANEDWRGVGEILAEGLNAAMHVVDDWINNTLRPLGVKWAGIVAEILNGLVDKFEWETLGQTIADGINAVFDIANTFLTKFNFENLGKGIGRALLSAFLNIDWKLIGETFANKFNALLMTIKGIVTTPGFWSSIGYAIKNFVNSWFENIKWAELGETVGKAISGIGRTLKIAVKNIQWKEIGQDFNTFLKEMLENLNTEDLEEAITGLIDGIGVMLSETFKDIEWKDVGDNIMSSLKRIWDELPTEQLEDTFNTLVSTIFQLLGGALSRFWEENKGTIEDIGKDIGSSLIAGLFLGVLEPLIDIWNWLNENVFIPVTEAFKELFGIHSPSTVFEEFGIDIIQGLINGIISMIDSIVQRFQQLRDDLINVLEDLKLRAKTKWEEIKTTIHTVIDALKQGAIDKFNDLKAKVIEIKENLKTKLNTIWTAIKTNIETWVNTIKTNAETKFTEMKNKLQELMETAKEKVVGAWSSMWSGIKSKINTIIGGVEKFANAIVDAINKVIEALNALGSVDIPANPFLPEGLHFGLSIPTLGHISIPRLAQGAVIPPNKEFLAMLGDQQRGVNIEAPLDTIVEAFRDVVANMQVENTGASEMVLDGEVFARLITPYVISELERSGYNVEVLEGNV